MNHIQIRGYKSIKELELTLSPVNIFIGANGSGKSNLLSFFDFLKNIYNRNLQEYVALRGGIDRFLHKGDKVTEEISAKLRLKNNAYSFTLRKGTESFIFTKERLWFDVNTYERNTVDVASLSTESNLRYNRKARTEFIQGYLNTLH